MDIRERQIVVIKLGGSLLSFQDLVNRFNLLLEQLAGKLPLLIVGGGQSADIVREWDRIYRLGEEAAHWLALESLKLNEALLSQLKPNLRIVTCREDAAVAWSQNEIPLLSTGRYLQEQEDKMKQPLPHDWGLTSDSIAAWVAWKWQAESLLLVKSVSIPNDLLEFEATLDAHFHQYASHLSRIDWVNLRDQQLSIRELSLENITESVVGELDS